MRDANLETLEKMDLQLPLTDKVAAHVLVRASQVQFRIDGMREFAGLKAGRVADAVNATADGLQQRLDAVLTRTQEGRKSMEYIRVGNGIVFADVAGQAQKLIVGNDVKLFHDNRPLFSHKSYGGDHDYVYNFKVGSIEDGVIRLCRDEMEVTVYLFDGAQPHVVSIEGGQYRDEFNLNVSDYRFGVVAKSVADREEEDDES